MALRTIQQKVNSLMAINKQRVNIPSMYKDERNPIAYHSLITAHYDFLDKLEKHTLKDLSKAEKQLIKLEYKKALAYITG
jgi:hypothetical protein